jgi:hypothetical protein
MPRIDDPVEPLRVPQPTTSGARTYAEHEAWVMEAPDHFNVVAFRGAHVYDRDVRPTLDTARARAREMYTNRPVMIYAVRGVHGIHLENFKP